jgi:predicted Zn-dependent protease
MIKKAVEQRPEDAYIVDSLGWAYFRIGRIDDAVRELERAVSLQPEDSVINDHLGDAYWKTGRKREALFQWAHARDLEPDEHELPKILAKLKGGLDAIPSESISPEPTAPGAPSHAEAPATPSPEGTP